MPKFTLDNSFRFGSRRETISNFHSESIETILKKLTRDWLGQFAREEQIQANLIGWKKMFLKINEVLDDAVERQKKDESVKKWLGKLRDLACDVDYLLDEFQTEAFQRMLLQGDDVMYKVKEVNARLQDIASQIDLLDLKEISRGKSRRGTVKLALFNLVLSAVKGGGRYRAIFSPLIKKADDLAFLEKEYALASLEKIGSGGAGEDVYKAELPRSNGKMIAIKKIVQPPMDAAALIQADNKLLNEKMMQIRSEIITAGQIWHRNILHLLAHVTRPDCHLLVYEFMKNGTLQDILNDVSLGRRELDWLTRHRIARGLSCGLEHLHMNHCRRIIHGDLNPVNVLLDDDVEAKISGFGFSRAIPGAHTHITTSNVVGTVGYMAPEYLHTLTLTEKCDIYSFGVLLAGLVMGKLPSDEFFQHTDERSFVKWMRNVMASENPNRAIDPKLLGNGYEKQMHLVLKIACFCTLEDPNERPNGKDVRCMLDRTARMSGACCPSTNDPMWMFLNVQE